VLLNYADASVRKRDIAIGVFMWKEKKGVEVKMKCL
jgi:hypothetical protein